MGIFPVVHGTRALALKAKLAKPTLLNASHSYLRWV